MQNYIFLSFLFFGGKKKWVSPPSLLHTLCALVNFSDSATPGQSNADKTDQPSCDRSHPERAVCVCKSQETITIALHWVSLHSLSPSLFRICMPVTRNTWERAGECIGFNNLCLSQHAAALEDFPSGSMLLSIFSLFFSLLGRVLQGRE